MDKAIQPGRKRADASRNMAAVLRAALAVFAKSGVDAPVREIAEQAGLGIGTLYRHYPTRAELIVAVVRQEMDACAEAAAEFAEQHAPAQALRLWMRRYVDFILTKRGLAAALYSGDPAYSGLPDYFKERMQPAVQALLDAALAAGQVRGDVSAEDLLQAGAVFCQADSPAQAHRLIGVLVDGLRPI